MTEQRKKIKCLAYYDTLDSKDRRYNNPAAYTKFSYVLECLQRLGYNVEILSASYGLDKKYIKGTTRKLSEKATLTTIGSLGRGNKLRNMLSNACFSLKLWFAVNALVKNGDTLLVYHSLGYLDKVKKLKKRKNIRLLLEVEEIYGYVVNSEKAIAKENELFALGDGFIFCTGLLEEEINTLNKPYAIVHGTYKTEQIQNKIKDDGRIHCVYAGTLDPRKGALNAVEAARYLDNNYHIHILGYGSEDEIHEIKSAIASVTLSSMAKVTYDGVLYGQNYTDFLSRCSVGLCTQSVDASFNGTSFPSKVLVYMANGLRVVSVRIPAIEKSGVGEFMCFYDKPDPESVAEAIKSIDFSSDYDGRRIIRELDKDFICDLNELLNKI